MDWLYSTLPSETYYNVTLFLSILFCEESPGGVSEVAEEYSSVDIVEIVPEKDVQQGFLQPIIDLFISSDAKNNSETSYFDNQAKEVESTDLPDYCQSFLNVNYNQSISFFYLALICVILTTIIVAVLTLCLKKLSHAKYESSKHNLKYSEVFADAIKSESTSPIADEKEPNKFEKPEKLTKNQSALPLVIDVPKISYWQLKSLEHCLLIESVFEETVGIFLKELDQCLGTDLCMPSKKGDLGNNWPTTSSFDASSLTSPIRSRRGLYSCHTTQSFMSFTSNQRETSQILSRCWIYFQNFKRQMSWVYPDIYFENFTLPQFSHTDNRLSVIVQFLHQRCSIKPRQWCTATHLVDYILFLLQHDLKALSNESLGLLKFSAFEGAGSAVNGTLAGSVDSFDVFLVMNISKCSEISILHNKFCADIPPGHVILGVKDGSISEKIITCCRKACIQGLSSNYLLPHQVEEQVDVWIKRSVSKFHRELKNKTDRLPIKIQMSPTKKLVLTIDVKLLQELGLGVGDISIKFIPVISIFVPQFGILPPLYVQPPWKSSNDSLQDTSSASNGFLTNIVRSQSHTDFLWEINTDKLQKIVTENIEYRFLLSGVRSYHKECLVILKALFSKDTENNLLNKGEIETSIIDTVVSFILQESPPSAWTFENIPGRISDVVTFLKHAYGNIMLPKFMVHNPHLLQEVPSLEVMSCLLSGWQQNLLAGVSADAAKKVIDYIDQRLSQIGLS